MKRKFTKYLSALLAAAALLTGCSKDVSFDTTFILKAWVQKSSGGEMRPADDLLLYGYSADTVQWTVASYDDALKGILTDKQTGEKAEPALFGTPYELEGFGTAQAMQVEGWPSLFVLAVDRTERLYGYNMLAMAENLPQMYVSLIFQPWKKSASFRNGTWWMFNDFYVPDVVCTLRPLLQIEEGVEPVTVKGVKLFAFRTDEPESWTVASFDDARAGILTNPLTGEKLAARTSVSGDSAGTLTLSIQPGGYLLLALDIEHAAYALRPITLESENPAVELALTFAVWRTDSPYADGEWSVWNVPQEPEQPENPENPENPEDPGQGEEAPAAKTARR